MANEIGLSTKPFEESRKEELSKQVCVPDRRGHHSQCEPGRGIGYLPQEAGVQGAVRLCSAHIRNRLEGAFPA